MIMKIYGDVSELIGKTPLMRAERYAKANGINADLLVKLECFNPAGSVKDRVALEMIEDAEKSGKIKPGDTLIEPTSGNTGIGLAAIGVSKGYNIIITMPDTMSKERIKTMEALGATVILTEGIRGMAGAIEKADELAKEMNGLVVGQFVNPANVTAHFETTGPEIYEDMDGKVDILVSAIGTGGTISGIGKYLKEQNKAINVIGVEPASSPFISEGKKGSHKIQGIGAGFIPEILDQKVIDEIITVTD
ncbi:MAG: pyridoxal-phosphate dependent enzyme, partial [Clostridia bacterium]|nr:pyridoxal-phosphate dependent enzyme [Clostridia bacterium]